MKEKKTNIRSFRYSDRVAEILEASEGDTPVSYTHLTLPTT